MRKLILAIVAFVVLASCVTNPVKSAPIKKPMGWGWAAVAGIIPGLPQVLNGEYLEAVGYFAAFMVPNMIATQVLGDTSTPVYSALMATSGAAWVWSYADGIYSSVKRTNQAKLLSPGLYIDPHQARYRLGMLKIGMKAYEVLQVLGQPDKVNTTVTAGGRQEQWVYLGYDQIGDEAYVYVEDGILTAWQG